MINTLLAATETGTATAGMGIIQIVLWVVVMGGMFYFMLIRPQKKQQKTLDDMHSKLGIGDAIITTSGFYGTILDIVEDTVIVEFGNNKNCRIPMKIEAIAQVEKASTGTEE